MKSQEKDVWVPSWVAWPILGLWAWVLVWFGDRGINLFAAFLGLFPAFVLAWLALCVVLGFIGLISGR
ncbi:MAG: hypothetical protein J5820_04135 [Rhodocyclaceae bacterium]|nr:hypothetical protein [Rhodocyclaceae bacterium]